MGDLLTKSSRSTSTSVKSSPTLKKKESVSLNKKSKDDSKLFLEDDESLDSSRDATNNVDSDAKKMNKKKISASSKKSNVATKKASSARNDDTSTKPKEPKKRAMTVASAEKNKKAKRRSDFEWIAKNITSHDVIDKQSGLPIALTLCTPIEYDGTNGDYATVDPKTVDIRFWYPAKTKGNHRGKSVNPSKKSKTGDDGDDGKRNDPSKHAPSDDNDDDDESSGELVYVVRYLHKNKKLATEEKGDDVLEKVPSLRGKDMHSLYRIVGYASMRSFFTGKNKILTEKNKPSNNMITFQDAVLGRVRFPYWPNAFVKYHPASLKRTHSEATIGDTVAGTIATKPRPEKGIVDKKSVKEIKTELDAPVQHAFKKRKLNENCSTKVEASDIFNNINNGTASDPSTTSKGKEQKKKDHRLKILQDIAKKNNDEKRSRESKKKGEKSDSRNVTKSLSSKSSKKNRKDDVESQRNAKENGSMNQSLFGEDDASKKVGHMTHHLSEDDDDDDYEGNVFYEKDVKGNGLSLLMGCGNATGNKKKRNVMKFIDSEECEEALSSSSGSSFSRSDDGDDDDDENKEGKDYSEKIFPTSSSSDSSSASSSSSSDLEDDESSVDILEKTVRTKLPKESLETSSKIMMLEDSQVVVPSKKTLSPKKICRSESNIDKKDTKRIAEWASTLMKEPHWVEEMKHWKKDKTKISARGYDVRVSQNIINELDNRVKHNSSRSYHITYKDDDQKALAGLMLSCMCVYEACSLVRSDATSNLSGEF